VLTFRLLLVAALALAQCGAAAAQALPFSLAQRIDGIVRKDMRTAATPGLSLAIVRRGRIAYVRAYGVRDLASRAPVDTGTIFRFGSVSKQFTAAALLMLAREGKLSLDDPLAKWFPSVTSARDVRIADLLAQVSGYRDYYPLDYCDREMSLPATMAEIVREYGAFPLTANPRTRFEYSNTNYLFAGLVAERVSGEHLRELLERRIFRPLGMTHTFYDEPYRSVADRATGYDTYFTEPQHTDPIEAPHWLNSAASLAGTASDLARWDIGLMNGALLDASSTKAMTMEHILMPGNVHTSYGLGQYVYEVKGHRIIAHGGNVIGFNAANAMAFDDRMAVVVLTNSYEGSAGETARDVLFALIPAQAPTPAASGAKPSHDSSPRQTPEQVAAIREIDRGIAALRAGTVSSAIADPDFLALMNAANTQRAVTALAHLGATKSVDILDQAPRGGLAVTEASVRFASGTRTAILFATPQGKIAELFLLSD